MVAQNYLTEDLISQILSRVSGKNLSRFTSVSKSWRSLIHTDPYLSRLQRTASLDRPCFVVKEHIIEPVAGRWLSYHYWIDLYSIEGHSINIREIDNPFNHDQECRGRDAIVLASCHDLLLLRLHHCNFYKYGVSNPITRKHAIVPPNPAGDGNVVYFGLGYDRVHDSYKLLTRVKRRDQSLELMVYDLDKGTWKRLRFGPWWKSQFEDRFITDYLYHRWDYCNSECVDGGVYWCFYMDLPVETRMMVCFLLAEEEFHVVKLPDPDLLAKYYLCSMTIFDGKLGFLCKGFNTRHEFWGMDMDYGGDGKRQWRWTKLLTISDVLPCHGDILTPMCFSACRNKILILAGLENQLFWYDMVKEEFNKLNNPINARSQNRQLLWYSC